MREPVLIVGGGAVGLYLGCLLRLRGVECLMVEARTDRSEHSRSIGIHPSGLRLMDEVGVAQALVQEGVSVRQGTAFAGQRPLGTLSFEHVPGSFPFVLALPQHRTEAHLEERFAQLGDPVRRGVTVTDIRIQDELALVTWNTDQGEESRLFSCVVACDGRRSTVRSALGIPFDAHSYDEHFVMGDTLDTTPFGADAAISVSSKGVVECFPLPEGQRRWVVRMDRPAPYDRSLEDVIRTETKQRTGWTVPADPFLMTSAFTAERGQAARYSQGPVVLVGDAAHVVSPIGGQGMNLGWLSAARLADALVAVDPVAALQSWEKHRRDAFEQAARRAEYNMWMGRSGSGQWIRRVIGRAMLSPVLSRWFARQFTMHGLD